MRVRCAGAGAALAELLAKAAQLLLGALEAGGRLAELLLQLGRLTLQPDVFQCHIVERSEDGIAGGKLNRKDAALRASIALSFPCFELT